MRLSEKLLRGAATPEEVADALGWQPEGDGATCDPVRPPDFVRSLDCIVAEIERRERGFWIEWYPEYPDGEYVVGVCCEDSECWLIERCSRPAAALCAALLRTLEK